ncbi:T9SS type A sorting domain-containing protein [Desertivirga xinjiangensis]|uniref:T9SS type A sorting domain-containing protein n=1 Tax=Desertivirga xinjiangensis TaxID=539206 RepID=UPI00210A0210|nr:T9SS type A sorting domain-containing protein [Pedobacter xinjiangensis]
MIKKTGFLIISICFLLAGHMFAQPAEALWALTSGQNASTTGSITAAAQNLAGLVHHDYISGGERTIPSGDAWPAQSSADPNRYFEYSVSPAPGKVLNISKIKASLSFNGSGAGRVMLSWTTDKITYTDLSGLISLNSASSPTEYTFDNLNINVNEGDTLYLRISPWTTSLVTGKYLVSKNVRIMGTTTQAPGVIWPLTSDQNASTTGNVYASAQTLKNLSVNNYIPGNGGQRLVVNSNNWPEESGYNNNRYIQYKVSPAAFYQMQVKEIIAPLSFNSSSFGKARIAYGIDSNHFITLVDNMTLVSGSLPYSYTFSNLNITVAPGQSLYIRVYPWTVEAISSKYLVSKNVTVKMNTEVAPQIAFPGAEGGGRNTRGGRGGDMYYVTNLNNSGPGSLRDAVSAGNRTVLFKVSGTIALQSTIMLLHDNITIAGQTAPGDGICLANYGMGIRANDVIVRYLRSRPGDSITVVGDSTKMVDAMYTSLGNPVTNRYKNIIIDHCSLSWSTDETGSFYAVSDFTLQWSILSESLYLASHPKPTPHGYGGIWGGQNASFHHNLLASHYNRNPRFSGSENTEQPEFEWVDFRNNVIFNWYGGTYGGIGGHQNMVNNYYKSGPATAGTARKKRILDYSNSTSIQNGKFYLHGNYVNGFSDVTADNWLGVTLGTGLTVDSIKVNTPFSYAPVRTQIATDAYTSVLDSAGAILPRRDTVDRRIIRETNTGTATYADNSFNVPGMQTPSGIINSQTTVGGWPILNGSDYPNDSDNDGLPNWWEARMSSVGSDSTSLNRNDYAEDGYTLLESYINAIPSPDQQVIFSQVSANRSGDTVLVDFKTNWAKDQFNFGLYRSADNTSFIKIAEISSEINSTAFSIADFNASASVYYYKVGSKRKDGTGDTCFSDVVMASNFQRTALSQQPDRPKREGLLIYPNPAEQQVNIRHSKAEPDASITIYNAEGRKLSRIPVQKDAQQSTITIADYPSGIYIVEFRNLSGKLTTRFIKQ